MTKFKKNAGAKLKIKAKKIYLLSGAEIQDVGEMQNNDMLYISQGEPFYKNAGGCWQHTPPACNPCAFGWSSSHLIQSQAQARARRPFTCRFSDPGVWARVH